jgi:predicted  nucleic acid-binding Zn-ribbon protein
MTAEEMEKLVQRVVELEDKQAKLEHEMTRLRSKISHLSARVR